MVVVVRVMVTDEGMQEGVNMKEKVVMVTEEGVNVKVVVLVRRVVSGEGRQ